MGFLDKLRMNNIFPRNPGTDRPFGMPEIDDGNSNQMMNQALGFARTSDNEAAMRQKDMMQFESDLRNPKPQLSITDRAYGRTQPLQPGMNQNGTMAGSRAGNPGSNSGFSPMQQQFRQDDLAARARQQEQSDMSAKFQQAMQLQAMKESGDMDLESMRGDRESANIEQRGGIDQRLAATRMQFDRDAAGTKSAAEIEAAKALQSGRERTAVIQGEQNRLTQSQKPPVGAAADPVKQFAERAQGLAIEAPALATMLVPPTESGGQFTISPKATPDQIVAIRKYMMGQQAAPAKPKSKVVTSPSKASIVDRTNQVSRR